MLNWKPKPGQKKARGGVVIIRTVQVIYYKKTSKTRFYKLPAARFTVQPIKPNLKDKKIKDSEILLTIFKKKFQVFLFEKKS